MNRTVALIVAAVGIFAAGSYLLLSGKTPLPRGLASTAPEKIEVRDLVNGPKSVIEAVQQAFRPPQKGEPVAVATLQTRSALKLRVPAIRGSKVYGWVELPRGVNVDLVGVDRDQMHIKYEDAIITVPTSAVIDGAV